MLILAPLLPSHQTRNDRPRRGHVCVSQMCHMTHPHPLAQVDPCANFPKTAKPNLILPLSFLIAPLSFHAAPGNAQCKPWPAPPTRNLMYDILKRGKIAHRTSHTQCAAELSREMHIFALSRSRAKTKVFSSTGSWAMCTSNLLSRQVPAAAAQG